MALGPFALARFRPLSKRGSTNFGVLTQHLSQFQQIFKKDQVSFMGPFVANFNQF
jgi:hypothetical protein